MANAVKSKPAPKRRQPNEYLGRTPQGTLIMRPPFRPKSFTVRQLREAIRAVREEAIERAG